MIGFTLIAEGLDVHVLKDDISFAMIFSFGLELLNIRIRRAREQRVFYLHK